MCATCRGTVGSHDDHDNFDSRSYNPRCSPNQPTSDKSSFIQKELTDANSSIHCCGNKFPHSSNFLCNIPTSNFQEHNAPAIVNLLNDDNNNAFSKTVQEDTALSSTFLQEWDAFYAEFKNSTTYALVQSSATNLHSSPIINDDDPMTDDPLPNMNSFNDSLCQLRRSIQALENVNHQFAQLLDNLNTLAPCKPTPQALANNLSPPLPCPEPQCDGMLQHILTKAPPPAPNPPHGTIQSQAHQPASQIEWRMCTASGKTPTVHYPAPTIVPCKSP